MPTKLLLDTDIGSDIDDALCLAYLLANPACDLLGITTVTGNTVERARFASALCRVASRHVPIYPGRRLPLLVAEQQPHVQQAGALARWAHDTDFPRGEAAEFLRRTIRAHPGEVTLLCIGPLTNVAALFAADEEIPGLLGGLVLMCGRFSDGLPDLPPCEWNAKLDPHATAVVYAARPVVHRSIGLDVTRQLRLPAAEAHRRLQASPLLRTVLDMAGAWFEEHDEVVFHDPLAATAIFDGAVCGFERGRVSVAADGLTEWQPTVPEGPHEVALSVQPERFFQRYFSMFPADQQPVR